MEPSARAALYQTLDRSRFEIRLLRIHESTDNGTVLHCDLTTISLDESKLDYHALSYEWGPPDLSEVNSVLVNSHKAITTLNLWLALNHLPKDQYYWIDFLCINQGDLDERASQVAMMTQIYNKAAIVEVWLGPEDHLSRKGLEMLGEYEKLEVLPDGRRDAISLWNLDRGDLWEGVCHILGNPYWTRTWIIQEIIVAKSDGGALLRIGNTCKTVLGLYMMVEDAHFAHLKSIKTGEFDVMSAQFRPVISMAARLYELYLILHWISTQSQTWRDAQLDAGKYLDLDYLLYCYSKQKCGDPRDHVYALLGISAKHDGLDLEINYKKSVEQVYISTALYLIQSSRTLDILTFVQPRTVDTHVLPTWVPDWR